MYPLEFTEVKRETDVWWQAEKCGFHLQVVETKDFNVMGFYWAMF